MTIIIPAPPEPPPGVHLTATKPDAGCATCGAPDTVLLHPHLGRQCPDHVTLPPGGFRADLAADMVGLGRVDCAFAYLAAWLVAEADRRFAAVAS